MANIPKEVNLYDALTKEYSDADIVHYINKVLGELLRATVVNGNEPLVAYGQLIESVARIKSLVDIVDCRMNDIDKGPSVAL